MFGMYRVFK